MLTLWLLSRGGKNYNYRLTSYNMCDAPVFSADLRHTYVTFGLNPADQRHICATYIVWYVLFSLQVSCTLLFYFIDTTVIPVTNLVAWPE